MGYLLHGLVELMALFTKLAIEIITSLLVSAYHVQKALRRS